jgi:hypothetical protein
MNDPRRGFVRFPCALFDDHTVSIPGKRAYLTLASHAINGDSVYPSVETLASESGTSARQVRRELKVLESSGWIVETGRRGATASIREWELREPGRFIQVPRALIADASAKSYVVITYAALASHISGKGVAFPSQKTIARESQVPIRSVQAALAILRQAGWLEDAGPHQTPATGSGRGLMRRVREYRVSSECGHLCGQVRPPVRPSAATCAYIPTTRELEQENKYKNTLDARTHEASGSVVPESGTERDGESEMPETEDSAQGDLFGSDPAGAPLPVKKTKSASKGRNPEVYTPAFLAFWDIYPIKVSKFSAQKMFDRALSSGVPAEVIMAGAARYAVHHEAEGTEPRYIKHPSTWLNAHCWEDELISRRKQPGADGAACFVVPQSTKWEYWDVPGRI